jgi:hypothetical protein
VWSPPGVGQDLQQAPDRLRLGRALDGQRPGRLGLDRVGDQPVGLLADQDLAGLGRLLEPDGHPVGDSSSGREAGVPGNWVLETATAG